MPVIQLALFDDNQILPPAGEALEALIKAWDAIISNEKQSRQLETEDPHATN